MIGTRLKMNDEQKIKLIFDTCWRRDELFLVIFRSYDTKSSTVAVTSILKNRKANLETILVHSK